MDEHTIRVYRGDDVDKRLTFTTGTGENKTPIDITDWEIRLTVRTSVVPTEVSNDTNALITVVKSEHTGPNDDPTNGITHIEMTQAQTNKEPGSYKYDIQRVNGQNKKKTIIVAPFIIEGEHTRS